MAKTNLFRHTTRTISFKAGEVIFEQDQPGDTMYVIVQGTVDILLRGRHMIKLEEGEIFGEMSLIEDEHKRTASAVAETDVLVAYLDKAGFTFLVHESPYFALDVMKTLAERLRLANKVLAEEHA